VAESTTGIHACPAPPAVYGRGAGQASDEEATPGTARTRVVRPLVCVPCRVPRTPPCQPARRELFRVGGRAPPALPPVRAVASWYVRPGAFTPPVTSSAEPSAEGVGTGGPGQATAGGAKDFARFPYAHGERESSGKEPKVQRGGSVPSGPVPAAARPPARPHARASYSKQQQQAWMRRRCRSGRTVLSRAKRSGGDSLLLTRVPCRCAFARVRCCSGLLLLVLVLGLEGQILHKEQPFAF
jgi:hypothetical protein